MLHAIFTACVVMPLCRHAQFTAVRTCPIHCLAVMPSCSIHCRVVMSSRPIHCRVFMTSCPIHSRVVMPSSPIHLRAFMTSYPIHCRAFIPSCPIHCRTFMTSCPVYCRVVMPSCPIHCRAIIQRYPLISLGIAHPVFSEPATFRAPSNLLLSSSRALFPEFFAQLFSWSNKLQFSDALGPPFNTYEDICKKTWI